MLSHLSRKDLLRYFKPAFLQRGKKYYETGRVIELSAHDDARLIRASVKGSGNNKYYLQIHSTVKNGNIVDIRGNCSCPVNFNCKHVVACLLYYMDQQPTRQEDLFGLASDKWLYQSKAVKPDHSPPKPSSEVILYILEIRKISSGHKLFVDSVKTRILKDGSYDGVKPFTGSPESRASYMREDDHFILLLLNSLRHASNCSALLEGEQGARALNHLMDTGRCHWLDEASPQIRHTDTKQSTLSWHFLPDASQKLSPDLLDQNYVVLPVLPPYYLDTRTGDCGVLDCHIPATIASSLLSGPAVMPGEVESMRKRLNATLQNQKLLLPEKPDIREINDVKPIPCLHLLNDQGDFNNFSEQAIPVGIAQFCFEYDGFCVHPLDKDKQLIRQAKDGFEIISRNEIFEKKALEYLDDIGLIGDDFYLYSEKTLLLEPVHVQDTWLDFMLHHRQSLEDDGWNIEIADDFVFQLDEADSWYAEIDQGSNDWFKFELGIEVDGQHINLLPLLVNYLGSLKDAQAISELQQLPDNYPLLFRQDNGHLLHIPLIKVRHIIDTLVELYDPSTLDRHGKLELSIFHSKQLSELENEHVSLSWAGGDQLRKFGQRLQDFEGIKSVRPPDTLKTELRDYQKEGLSWLQFLREYDLGGILADDMGLGKTVQTLAHLLIEKNEGRADCPTLVVAPTSLMVNWKRETARFAPDISVLVLQGVDRKQNFSGIPEYDLVLTTYPLLSRDSDILLQQQWHIVVLDEAQHIKNPVSKAAQTARLLKTRHRLCLTGTPMENHLGELWSLFYFLMPGLLGDEKRFRKLFRIPIEKHQDVKRQQQLLDRVSPFLLRRDKARVATELPAKTEILSEVELQGAQRDLYEAIRVSMHDRLRQVIGSQGIARSQIMILDALLKLRQVCCHPQLLNLPSAKKIKHSAKLNQLMEMLPEMLEEGRRILLFSQFTSMLALIEEELVKHNIEYVTLTGKTRNREKPIDEFQSGKVPLFLISLKAGGSGLNLTAADTVIHYDPWWNPAAEQQATDRAHRIGQDKPVFVYKLITVNTVEEKILEMQQRKRALTDALIAQSNSGGSISQDDILVLFEPLV